MRQRHIEMRVWERHISIAVHGVTQTSIIVSVAAYWCDGRQSVAQQHPPCPGRQSSLIFSRVDVPKVQFVQPRSSSQRLQHAACVDLSRPRCETAMTGGVDVCAKDGMWAFTRGDATGGRGASRGGAKSDSTCGYFTIYICHRHPGADGWILGPRPPPRPQKSPRTM